MMFFGDFYAALPRSELYICRTTAPLVPHISNEGRIIVNHARVAIFMKITSTRRP